jgi:hypothetical protein
MKSQRLILLAALFVVLSFNSCSWFCKKGEGNVISKSVQVTDFDEIKIEGQATVFIEQATTPTVKIMIDSNLYQYLDVEVSGMKLKIKERRCMENLTDYKVYITTNRLVELLVDGSVKVTGESTFKSEKIKLLSKSSGEIKLNLDVDELDIHAEGSGMLKLYGRVLDMDINLKGAASLDAFGLQAKNVDAEIDGAGTCKIEVSEKFNAEVGGSGKLYYKGNPKKVNTNVTGSGTIQAK